MIDHYSLGSITIDGKNYSHDVIVSGGDVKSWWRATSHNVSINDLAPILEEKPRLIIFGTGAAGVMRVPKETAEYLEKRGIKIQISKTAEAVKRFNQHLKEAGMVGAFHLTC